jgi:hypothetical protein
MKRSSGNQVEPRRGGGISAVHGCRRAAAVSSPRRCLRSRTRLGSDRRGVGLCLGALGECRVNDQPDRLPVQGRSEPNQASTSSSRIRADVDEHWMAEQGAALTQLRKGHLVAVAVAVYFAADITTQTAADLLGGSSPTVETDTIRGVAKLRMSLGATVGQ